MISAILALVLIGEMRFGMGLISAYTGSGTNVMITASCSFVSCCLTLHDSLQAVR
ncbi:MAG: hypothetical protein M9928_17770 [Anaerolineae bacterium]|nr:hypothetical protein [Anaerolineae bacterium]